MKIRTAITPALLAAGLLAFSHAEAAISIVDTMVDTSVVDGLSYTINASGLNASGASKLVVTLGAEGADSNTATPGNVDSFTYGGVPLALIETGGGGRSSIWYLDLGGASPVGTDISLVFAGDNGGVNTTNVRGYFLSAYTLAGTANGVSSSGQSPYNPGTGNDDTLTQISPTTANEFLIAGFSRNNATAANPITPGLALLAPGNVYLDNQYNNASIYGTLSSAGTQIIQIDGMNGSGRTVIATFAAAVPEPSSTLLLGLGGLTIFFRRRRA